jgi:hypothetical protein
VLIISIISKYYVGVRLETLNCEGVIAIKDVGLESIGQGCRKLKFINLAGCVNITDRGKASDDII